MKLGEIAGYLGLENLTPEVESIDSLDISAGHSSDLLSDVLANAPSGGALVTIQVNMSVIAVALHATVAAIIFTSGMVPKEEIIKRAATEKLPLYSSKESTFDIVGRLYLLGLRGDRR